MKRFSINGLGCGDKRHEHKELRRKRKWNSLPLRPSPIFTHLGMHLQRHDERNFRVIEIVIKAFPQLNQLNRPTQTACITGPVEKGRDKGGRVVYQQTKRFRGRRGESGKLLQWSWLDLAN